MSVKKCYSIFNRNKICTISFFYIPLHLQCLENKSQNGGELILLYIEKQAVLQTLLIYLAKDLDPDDSDALNLVCSLPAQCRFSQDF